MSKKARSYETSTGYRGSEDYIVSDDLRNCVNIAIALQKPLLIKGEPGTGKTMLAQSIADSLDKELIIWNIKSTTKAQEGLYVYDTVQRLYDSQFGEGDVANIKKYIKLGKLGEAFIADEPVVLLIDEIDKADLEFPNDLLWELDQMSFYIPETKETIQAIQRPIVVITSNAEKELPDAFLRRCIFHYIEFPDPEGMERIVRVHHPSLEKRLLEQAMETFYMLRNVSNIQKKPSTSELIDWLQALVVGGINPNRIKQDLPFLGVLLKKNEDLDTLLNQLHGKTQTRSPNYVNSSLNRFRY
jgi:MoxR-like ATPase